MEYNKIWHELLKVDGFWSFIEFFGNQSLPIQIIIGFVIFGLLVLIYIFVVAMFSDNYN